MIRKKLIAMAAVTAMVAMIQTAQASIISIGSGAGNTGFDTPVNTIDDQWTLLSTTGGGTPPNAYIANDAGAFPFQPGLAAGWINNTDPLTGGSKWITYSSPLFTDFAATATFVYRLSFDTALLGESVLVQWLSDNTSTLKLDGLAIGTRTVGDSGPGSDTYNSWNAPLLVNLLAGAHTLDIVVVNDGGSSNPTGARFQATPVPEPTTVIAGAMLLLPFAASTLRMLRKNRTA